MSQQPDPYNPSYNFTDFQQGNPTTPLPADELDAQLNSISTSINETQDRLAEIQNDDGSLKNASVGNAQLKSEVTIGVSAAEDWLTATVYEANDTVYSNSNVYRCLIAHTSGVFATDLAAGKWTEILDFNQYLSQANASAEAAAASAAAAELAQQTAESAAVEAANTYSTFANRYQVASSPPALRPNGGALQDGDLYENTASDTLFIRKNGVWVSAAAAIIGTFVRTEATGNGVNTSFNVTYDVPNILVYVAGVLIDVDDYTALTGTTVVFDVAPANLAKIDFIALGTFSVGDIADDAIATSNLQDGAVTPAKSEPGAYHYAIASNSGVYNIAATYTPPLPALANGTVVRLRPRVSNWSGSTVSVSSITSSGNTATVNATSHGLVQYDVVSIVGAVQKEYNGLVQVDTVPNANSFTYKFKGSATTPATGSVYIDRPVIGGQYAGAVTFNPDGLGAKDIFRRDGRRLLPGDIVSNHEITLIYSSLEDAWLLQTSEFNQFSSFISSSTSGTDYAVSIFDLHSKVTPLLTCIKVAVSNSSTAPTLTFENASDDAPYTLTREGGALLRLGDIAAGGWSLLQRNGSTYELLNPKSSVNPVATLQHQAAAGTNGGTATAGAWETAPYNTEASDSDGIVSLSSNDFTLQAGTYLIRWSRGYYSTLHSQTRLYRTTNTPAVEAYGTVVYAAYSATSEGEAIVTTTVANTYRIQSRVGQTYSGVGFGFAANWSATEVYGGITIQKLA